VYPLPHHDQLTLGVHFTKTLWGTTLVGPTATYVEGKENYERGRMEIAEFARRTRRRMLPEIRQRIYSWVHGLRPEGLKAQGEKGIADFVIEADREVPRVIFSWWGLSHRVLTAAPAIAERVGSWLPR